MKEKNKAVKKLFELGVRNGLEADDMFKHKIISYEERHLAYNLRIPPEGYFSGWSINPDPPLLYPKWCYDELQFGINQIK